jgi:hypothetical protein
MGTDYVRVETVRRSWTVTEMNIDMVEKAQDIRCGRQALNDAGGNYSGSHGPMINAWNSGRCRNRVTLMVRRQRVDHNETLV